MPAAKTLPPADTVEEVPAPAAKDASPAVPGDTFGDEPAAEADDPVGADSSSREMSEDRAAEKRVQDELTSAEDEDTLGERAVQSEVEAVEGR
jgi:hypothetical protein